MERRRCAVVDGEPVMPSRDIRHPGHRGLRGFYPSRKAGRTVAFESRLERDHLFLLDADPDVVSFEEQPVTIHFQGQKHPRRYTPDCRVEYRSRPTELVEVKYAADLDAMPADVRAAHAEAHVAATTWCAERGWRFVLRTDRDILGPALDRAHALHAFARLQPDALVTPAVVEAYVASYPGVTVVELARTFAERGPIARRVALHLVWRGRLRDVPFAVPSDSTRLYLAETSR